MSAYGGSQPPALGAYDQGGVTERRSTHPVNQLGRRLNDLCLEASDPYEITAHLEALGYNNANVASQYGVADHFELAWLLFDRTPRRFKLHLPSKAVRASYTRQAVMVLTLLVTAGIGFVTEVGAWGPVVWLLLWSQLGGALLNRAKSDLAVPDQARVLSLLLQMGLAGLVSVWLFTPFALATWVVSLLWLGVAGLLWGERVRAAYVLPVVGGALLILSLWFGLQVTTMLAACGLAALLALRSLVVGPTLSCWRWALAQWRHLVPFGLYGLGQSALLFALLVGAGPEALPGTVLFAVVLLFAEPHLLWLRGQLSLCLWQGQSAAGYARCARRLIVRYTSVYLLPFLPALIVLAYPTLFGSQWFFHLAGFALFGFILGLALVSLSLGNSAMPALVFAGGGALVMFGAPVLWVCAAMAVVECAALLRRSAQLGSYGVFLL